MLHVDLENEKGSLFASARIPGPWLSGRPKDHEKPHQPRTFVTVHGSWDRGPRTGRSRVPKLYLVSSSLLPRKPNQNCKKEKYNGRLQKSH
jgi:hypothetical protein